MTDRTFTDRGGDLYRSLVICPECEAVIEERGIEYEHHAWCITQEEEPND